MVIGIDLRVLGTGRVTGVEEYARQLMAHLLPLNPEQQFVLFISGRDARQGPEAWWNGANVRIYTHRGSNRLLSARMRLTGRPRLDELVGGADVFFFPHFLYAPLSAACPRVVTFHDLSYERFPEFLSRRRRLWHRSQMRPHLQARQAGRLIAVSHSTARDLQNLYGVDPRRVSVIHSGIDPSLSRPDAADVIQFRRRRGLPERFVLSLCTMEPRKNLAGLVRAFELLAARPNNADVHLCLAGPSGWLSGDVASAVRRSPVADRIRLPGPVPQEERALWYSASAVFTYPSFFEGFGFPPLEAMACGTPVVAAHASSLGEVVGDAGLLVDPYDVGGLAAALDAVLGNPALAARMSQAGLARARKFSWTSAARQTLEAITDAVRYN